MNLNNKTLFKILFSSPELDQLLLKASIIQHLRSFCGTTGRRLGAPELFLEFILRLPEQIVSTLPLTLNGQINADASANQRRP